MRSEAAPAGPPSLQLPPVSGPGRLSIGAVFRHRLLIAACVCVAGVLGAASTRYLRPVYEATSVVRFEIEQVDLPQLVQVVASDNLIRTEIEVVSGRTVSAALIDSLGLRARLIAPRSGRRSEIFALIRVAADADSGTFRFRSLGGTAFGLSTGRSNPGPISVKIGDTVTVAGVTLVLAPAAALAGPDLELRVDPLDVALARLESNLKVSRPARDADLLTIKTRSSDPAEAAAMANVLADGIIARRREVRRGRTTAAAAFLREQADSLGRQLRRAENGLRDYRERHHVVDAPGQARTEVTRLAGLQAELSVIRSDRDAFASLVEQLRRDSAGAVAGGQALSRRLMAFPSLLQNQSASTLLGSLAQVENERAALLIRRLPTDPDVQVLTRRIQELELQLRNTAESYLQSRTNQVKSREREAGQFAAQLDGLPEKELQVARREREARILSDLWILVQTRLKEAEITGGIGDPAVRLVDAAVPPVRPIRPRPAFNLALALMLGTLVGVAGSLSLGIADRSVRSRADAHAAAGLPVLGAFPRVRPCKRVSLPWLGRPVQPSLRGADSRLGRSLTRATPQRARGAYGIESRLVTHPKAPGAYTEAFNQLFASLALSHRDQPLKVVVFTSPLPGEGKTLSAVNFALTGTTRGHRVLLVDADLRCGVVNQVLGCDRGPGLSELLAGTASLEQVLRPVSVGTRGRLMVIPRGTTPRVPGRLLTLDKVKSVLAQVTPDFDMIVIDSPPVNLLADAALLGAASDGVMVVVRAGRTPADALRYAMGQLESTRAPVLGLLLNDIDLRRNEADDDSYRYLVEAERYHAAVH